MTNQEMLQERAVLIKRAQAVASAAKLAGRGMTAEENAEYDRLFDAAGELQSQVEASATRANVASATESAREERARRAEAFDRQSRGRAFGPQPVHGSETAGGRTGRETPFPRGSAEDRRSSPEYASAFSEYVRSGGISADLQTDIGEKGGYLAPVEFVQGILKTLDNGFWFRGIANVLPATNATQIRWPRRTGRLNSCGWGSELSVPAIDTGVKTGAMTLEPHYMTAEIDVSNDLLASGVVDVEQFVTGEILYACMELEENAFMTGDGVRKPLGVFTPSVLGIDTGRDVTYTAGSLTYDALCDAKYKLREPYLRSKNLRWLAHRNFVKAVAKLKATTGEPLWVPSVRDGEPDRLLNVPVTMSEYAPAGTNGAHVAGQYAATIGDFSNYAIMDALNMDVQRLKELAARTNQTVYIVRRKVDGAPMHAEAFARLLAA